jgi:hypothetical protein
MMKTASQMAATPKTATKMPASAATCRAVPRFADLMMSIARPPKSLPLPTQAAKSSERVPRPGTHPHPPPGGARERQDDKKREDDLLDPSARHAAQLAPPPLTMEAPIKATSPDSPVAAARAALEELLPAMVKRVAWSGDARRGAVRLELGAGPLAGGTLLVEAHDGVVRVRVDAPAGVDVECWKARISDRLKAARITSTEVVVE